MHTPRLWVSLFAIVTLLSGHVSAQDFERGQIELTRQAVQSKRQEIVTNAMNLTDEESQKFWPVFRDWRAKNAGLGDRRVELLAQMDEAWGGMTEEQAQAILRPLHRNVRGYRGGKFRSMPTRLLPLRVPWATPIPSRRTARCRSSTALRSSADHGSLLRRATAKPRLSR